MSEAKFILLPEGVLSFPRIDKLQYSDQDVEKKNGKYSLNVILPASADLGPLKEAIKAAAFAKFGDKVSNAAFREKMKFPIRKGSSFTNDDGDLYAGYKEDDQVVPVSFFKPMTFLDQFKNKIASDSQQAQDTFYAGCKVTIAVTAHGFDNQSKGVRLALYALMKTGEGEKLGGAGVGDPDEVFAGMKAETPSPVSGKGKADAASGDEW